MGQDIFAIDGLEDANMDVLLRTNGGSSRKKSHRPKNDDRRVRHNKDGSVTITYVNDGDCDWAGDQGGPGVASACG